MRINTLLDHVDNLRQVSTAAATVQGSIAAVLDNLSGGNSIVFKPKPFFFVFRPHLHRTFVSCTRTDILGFCSCQISLFTRSLVIVLECFLEVRRQMASDFFMFSFFIQYR